MARLSANPRRRIPAAITYIAYPGVVAKDFTLKFEIKVEGSGGSGFQYRSKTGIPWLANIADNVTANVGPVNLAWMMTGPQADFWPSSRDWTGQFYSENTPMRIQAWRGQVAEGAGLGRKRLMGNIGDREALAGHPGTAGSSEGRSQAGHRAIRIGIDQAAPYQSWVEGYGPVGFTVDVITAAARQRGITLQWTFCP